VDKQPHADGGNVAMGDGSVQQVNSRNLVQALRDSGLATNRLACRSSDHDQVQPVNSRGAFTLIELAS